MTVRPRPVRTRLSQGVAAALLTVGVALGVAANAQSPAGPVLSANAGGPPWSALTPAQQSALAPLKKDWQSLDAPRKQKWLEVAARLPSMPAEQRRRIQERMGEWTRMSPDERGRARLQFQEARQISPQERQARWDAYLALPAEERRALANSAKTEPKASRALVRKPIGEATVASMPKNNVLAAPSANAAAKTAAPTVVQAKPGASTTLISKTAAPPAPALVGRPKIVTGQDKVDRRTLLPQAAPHGAAASASSAR